MVLVAGKGHETTQTSGTSSTEFDDRVVLATRCRAAGRRLDRRTRRVIALLMAGGLSLAVSLVGTRFLIVWLQQHQIGQTIREEGPAGHQVKAGTPTMGGIAIVAGAVVGYSVAHLRSRVVFTRSGMFVLALVVGAGLVGFLDDWIKITHERNLGLNKRAKILGLLRGGRRLRRSPPSTPPACTPSCRSPGTLVHQQHRPEHRPRQGGLGRSSRCW